MKKENGQHSNIYTREIGEAVKWSHLPPVKLLRIEPRGHGASVVNDPPKKRGLVIALGWKGQMAIAFPYGTSGADGYHDNSEAYLSRAIGVSNLWTIMHGSVEKEGIGPNGKRVVYIYEMPERDKKMIQDVCHDLTTQEKGTVSPKEFLKSPDYIPERILQAMQANELRIVKGVASRKLFHL